MVRSCLTFAKAPSSYVAVEVAVDTDSPAEELAFEFVFPSAVRSVEDIAAELAVSPRVPERERSPAMAAGGRANAGEPKETRFFRPHLVCVVDGHPDNCGNARRKPL